MGDIKIFIAKCKNFFAVIKLRQMSQKEVSYTLKMAGECIYTKLLPSNRCHQHTGSVDTWADPKSLLTGLL